MNSQEFEREYEEYEKRHKSKLYNATVEILTFSKLGKEKSKRKSRLRLTMQLLLINSD